MDGGLLVFEDLTPGSFLLDRPPHLRFIQPRLAATPLHLQLLERDQSAQRRQPGVGEMGSQEPQPQTLDLFEFAQLDEFLIAEERITAKFQAFQFLELSQQPDRFDGHAVARMIDVQIGKIIARIRTATGEGSQVPWLGNQ